MNLPRLIIADENKPGMVPMSLILIYALKRSGIKVKVFTCARTESDMRLLKLLLGEPIVTLDSFACGNVKNMKTLFQSVAQPDALNVILISIGTRQGEDFIQIAPDVVDVAKALSCGIVPVISAEASTILTANAAMTVLTALENEYPESVLGVIFALVKNPREYQLLEQEFGRRTPVLSLGYIPKEVERALPSLYDMYNTAAGIMQIKSAALQLVSTSYQVEWNILDAFGQLKKAWVAPERFFLPPKNFKVAIVGSQALSLEGDNSAELFKLLGCEVIDYDPWQEPFPREAEVIYFPHSAGSLYCDRLLGSDAFLQGIKQAFAANKLIFVNGASAPIFGQSIIAADGNKHGALGFFKFRSSFAPVKTQGNAKRIEIRGTTDSILTRHDEKMKGYALDYLSVSNPGNVEPPVWAYRDVRKDSELGMSGWVKGYCFVTDLCVELWSSIETVNHWLSLRKR